MAADLRCHCSPSGTDTIEQCLGILEAAARRTDADTVHILLQELPQIIAQDRRVQLERTREEYCAMRYHGESQRAYWIAADAQHLLCVPLPALTEAQAAQVSVEIDERRCRGDVIGIMAAYADVTGSSLRVITRN